MYKRICVVLTTVAIAGSLTHCASLINGTTQEVSITSQPPGATARIVVADKVENISNISEIPPGSVEGEKVVTTPATVELDRSEDYLVFFNKEEYNQALSKIEGSVSGWFFANLLLGGIIGMIIDAAVGAMWTLEPENINVVLEEE